VDGAPDHSAAAFEPLDEAAGVELDELSFDDDDDEDEDEELLEELSDEEELLRLSVR
jgi:hypothetical protein